MSIGVCTLAIVLLGTAGGATALAAETHVFDPNLSLTGGCGTSPIDPVADPGCPDVHAPSTFSSPRSVTTDFYGNVYVASYGKDSANGAEGRIDIFNAEGVFVEEIPDSSGPKSLAVDSEGNLYVFSHRSGTDAKIQRYAPTGTYNPAGGEIAYDDSPTLVAEHPSAFLTAIAINPENDHLFVHWGVSLFEYGSAAEENKLLDEDVDGEVLFHQNGAGLAIDSAGRRIYASDRGSSPGSYVIRVFELDSPHTLLATIDGSTLPTPLPDKFSLAVDEGTGNIFVYDGEIADIVYELTKDGTYVSTIDHQIQGVVGGQVGVDNGPFSPNGALNPDGRYVYVPSHPGGVGRTLAFGPAPKECPPEVEALSFSAVSEDDARLSATLNPCNLETEYTFEFEEAEGSAGAVVAGAGKLPPGSTGVDVSAYAEELSAGTTYRFRIVASNAKGSDEAEGEFTTYPASGGDDLCPNEAVRTGFSALLPDCRAYELVTPADTNARAPLGVGYLGVYFTTRHASPSGNAVSFQIEGGSIPGNEATGSFAGDPYLATREAGGWGTSSAGPNGTEAVALLPGSNSPDQGYSFWTTASGSGSAAIGGKPTSYVRYPDGHSELVGRGSIGTDPRAEGKLISENGGHIIFVSRTFGEKQTAIQLEENAPPDGTAAIYDRTADEVTHVVSLLPGDVTPAAGQDASYVGASLDGLGVAFRIGSTLYLRYDNEETYEIGENVTFAGVAEGGDRIFYVEGGNLLAFDVEGEEAIPFSSSGDVTPVNVSADGTAAYLVSPSVLTGEGPNGTNPQAGKRNLYLSQEGTLSFVGTVTDRDVEGESGGNIVVEGLGLWTDAVGPGSSELPGRLAIDPSRVTPDGTVLLFESRANLTSYDSQGLAQVYRYDSVAGTLQCLSCNPTGTPAAGAASLQSISQAQGAPEPLGPFAIVNNLRADGRRAFFQSFDALVAADTDGLQDVYEWEANGVGSCKRPEGCVYLISSGSSERVEYLFAVSDSGNDVFFRSSDLLVPADTDETPSIYDARVGGGFPEAAGSNCEGEGCRPVLTPTPSMLVPPPPPG
ncbi:MAG: hypothetical protein M3335_08245, partial [Actinomycetota bacterium]|nr:hypothetical protein [Actinomycetota bacterium]